MTNPFLKWADNKAELVPRILDSLPSGQRLIEPFAGSCAVSLNAPFEQFLMVDANLDLFHLYSWLKRVGADLAEDCQMLFTNGLVGASGTDEGFYYACRQQFNEAEFGDYWRAVLFVYLNRHGYNGLCHYDENGDFDVPFGMYRRPRFPGAEMIAFAQWAQQIDFVHGDFRVAMERAQPGDVVYCDPPNLPLTTIDGLVAPMAEGFPMAEHIELVARAQALADQGIPVLISSLDTPEARELYVDAEIDTFPVRRYIQDKRGARAKVWEIVALFR